MGGKRREKKSTLSETKTIYQYYLITKSAGSSQHAGMLGRLDVGRGPLLSPVNRAGTGGQRWAVLARRGTVLWIRHIRRENSRMAQTLHSQNIQGMITFFRKPTEKFASRYYYCDIERNMRERYLFVFVDRKMATCWDGNCFSFRFEQKHLIYNKLEK